MLLPDLTHLAMSVCTKRKIGDDEDDAGQARQATGAEERLHGSEYTKALQQVSEEEKVEHERMLNRFRERVGRVVPSARLGVHSERLSRYEKHVKDDETALQNLEAFITATKNCGDHSNSLPATAEEMVSQLKTALTDRAGLQATNVFPMHIVAWKRAQFKAQADLVYKHYETYEPDPKAAQSIGEWTAEAPDEHVSPMHHVVTSYMLAHVKLSGPHLEGKHWDSDKELRKKVRDTVQGLYKLIIEAPKAPFPLLLLRTVRQKAGLPTAWFRKLFKREMTPGDSMILPMFLSTTMLSYEDSWTAHGPDAFGAHTPNDDFYPSVDGDGCCMMQILVSPGVPMLPLAEFEGNEHAQEQEVLLPPGIELVFMNEEDGAVITPDESFEDETSVKMYSFLARVGSAHAGPSC